MYREFAVPPLECLWVRVSAATTTEVLPDGCSDLVWQAGRGAFVAGPDTGPVAASAAPGTVFVGARFRPGAGGAALGVRLSELRDLRVGLEDLRPDLAERLPAELDPLEAARVETLADDLGLSERQLRRRFHAAAGYGPKTLQRVLRFRRFLAAADRDLARAALDAGYADQSHLTRECTRLAGRPPAALLAVRA